MRRFAWFGFALCAAVFAGLTLRWRLAVTAALACFCVAACLLSLLLPRQRERAILLFLGLACGLGWSSTAVAAMDAATASLTRERVTVTATVTEDAVYTGGALRLTVRLNTGTLLRPGARLYIYGDALPAYAPGDVVEVSAQFRSTEPEEDFLTDSPASRGVFLTAAVSGAPNVVKRLPGWQFFPQTLRREATAAIQTLYGKTLAPFLSALLVGNRNELSSDVTLYTAMRRAGVAHIVAVSGMHVTFFASLLQMLFRRRRLCLAVSLPAIALFMAVTGFTPSVVRAGIMQLLLLLLPESGKCWDGVTALAVALTAILLVNPWAASSVGLQMSFAAAMGICLFSGRLQKRAMERLKVQNRVLRGVIRFFIANLAISLGALVFTLPLSVLYYDTVSLIGPVANLLLAPLICLLFSLGILSCALYAVFSPLGAALAAVAGVIGRLVLWLMRAMGSFRHSAVYTSNLLMALWLVLLYGGAGLFGLLHLRLRVLLILFAAAGVLLCLILLLTPRLHRAETLTAAVLDVGQGQCVVLRSDSATVMVDCGSSSGADAGGVAGRYLASVGEDRVDALVLTHYHADHTNGVEELLAMAEVTTLLVPVPAPEDTERYDKLLALAESNSVSVYTVSRTSYVAFGSSELVIYPPAGGLTENERCCSVLAREGEYELLMTGDMPDSEEKRLVETAHLPDIEVLIVGHHGSRTSACEELLDAVTPETAVISVGRDNPYGHPSEKTLDRLEERGITIYRTDLSGSVILRGT